MTNTALRELTEPEKATLLDFFVHSDYVLNFSKNGFDVFSAQVIRYGLCSKYNCTAGLSLRKFVNESGHPREILALLKALLVYYCEQFPGKIGDSSARSTHFEQCERIVNNAIGTGEALVVRPASLDAPEVAHLKEFLVDALSEIERSKADSAITKAKAAFEGTMRYAIALIATEPSPGDDIIQLFGKFKECYGLQVPKGVINSASKLLQNLTTAVQMIAEIRNNASDSHGRSEADPALPDYLSRLYVNASATLCDYILSVARSGGVKNDA